MKKNFFRALLPVTILVVMTVVMALVHRNIGQPWSGIMAFITYGGYMLYAGLVKKSATQQEPAVQEEAGSTEKGRDFTFAEQEEHGDSMPFLLVLHSLSGKIYQVFRGRKGYYFCQVGNELKGIDGGQMRERCPSDIWMNEDSSKRFILPYERVQRFTLKMAHSVSTRLPNSGTITFYTPKKKRYMLLLEVTPQQAEQFFSDLRDRTEKQEKTYRRQKNIADKAVGLGQWRRENQLPEVLKTLRGITVGLTAAGATLSLALNFLPVPYKLAAWALVLLSLICLTLPLIFPAYYSLTRTTEEAKAAEGVVCIGWLYPMIACNIGLALRGLVDFNFVNGWDPFSHGIALTVGLTLIFILRCRELRWRIGKILAVMFLMFYVAIGLATELNYLLDMSEIVIEEKEVLDMHIATSSKGPSSYNCTVEIGGKEVDIDVGKDIYETIVVGESVEVGIKNGALGMAYCQLRKIG